MPGQAAPVIARYIVLAFAIAVITTMILMPVVTSWVEDWSRRDVEVRSTLVFNSIETPLARMVEDDQSQQINELFERVAGNNRITALAICTADGVPKYASKFMPTALTCEKIARSETETFSFVTINGLRMLASAFPIKTGNAKPHLIVLNDLSFAERRGAEARNYMAVFLAGIVLASGALAISLTLFLIRRWTRSFKQAVSRATRGNTAGQAFAGLGPVDQEVRQVLRQLQRSRTVDGEHTEWTKTTLRHILRAELPDVEVMVVANREPYIHNRGPEGIELQRPASGLVSALEPVMRACGGTWIAHGSGTADADTVDANDRLAVPPDTPEYTLRRVWISEDEQDGYYYGLANEGLWPLCHIAFTRPIFRETDWRTYRDINERFADAVVKEAKTATPIVLVQDYHFALLPQMIRERLPDATIIMFWHIPWPNAETFGIFPWKEEIIHGLLGSSIIGFHTQFHCNNFFETVDRFVESRIDREQSSITSLGNETLVRPYPISIDWPPAALAGQKSIEECRRNVRARLAIPADAKIAVGIERFDYTKGVLDRIAAVDTLLSAHPEWIGRFVLVQAAAPTRSKLAAYKGLQEEAVQLSARINEKYAQYGGPPPVQLVIRHHEPHEVFELFRAADACIVSSLHDGMNLVAKEFVAARNDDCGVLLLSNFAGASRELGEALLINPYDAYAMGEALHQALSMPEAEQMERMRLMRSYVRSRNVYRWAGQMLLDASRMRKKGRILQLASTQDH